MRQTLIKDLSRAARGVEWKAAVKTGLAASLGMVAGVTFSRLFERVELEVSTLWTTMAAIVVQQNHLGSTYRTAWTRLLGVFIGCMLGGFFSSLWGTNPLTLCLSIMFTIAACSLVKIKESVRIACLSVAVVMIRPSDSPWEFGWYRFMESGIGIGVALLVAHLVWPSHVERKIGSNIAAILNKLAELYRHAVCLQPLTETEKYIFSEKASAIEELLWKNRQYLQDSQLELLSKYSGLDQWQTLFSYLDSIFEKILALRKVHKDHLKNIVDEGVQRQLTSIVASTDQVFSQLAQVITGIHHEVSLSPMMDAADLLEQEIARLRALRVTRQMSLEDVEGFFVFFYLIRTIAVELEKIHKDVFIT